MKKSIIISSPSLDIRENVSGVSSVVRFIIDNNPDCVYHHFCIGRKDTDENGKWMAIKRTFKTFLRWKRMLRQHPKSLLHYNYPLDAMSIVRDFFFMQYALLKNRKIVVHIHGGLYLTKEKRPWLINMLLKRAFGWNCTFLVLSENEKTILQQRFNARNVEVLPNCVPLDDAEECVKDFSRKKHFNLLYIGRIEVNKGIDQIIDACVELKKRNFDFTLHVAGKEKVAGEYLPGMKDLLGDNLVYEGVVFGQTKIDLFKICDIFLLPSYYEGLPMALIEAMSFGLVPICTNVGSIGTVVKNGTNGIMVPIKNSDAIVEGVIRLFADGCVANDMSFCAKKTIFDNFSPQRYVDKLNQIYLRADKQ